MKTISTSLFRLSTIGLAALACSGHAAADDSSVTLYGLLDIGAYSKQLSGEKRLATISSGNMSSSRWGLRGSEDLGGGLRARFDISSYIRVDTGAAGRADSDPFWARYAWVGLESSQAGLLRAGRMSTPNFLQTIRFNPFVDSALSPAIAHIYVASATQPMMTGEGTSDTMWTNAVAYNTPAGLGGFEGALMASASEGTTAGRRLGGSAGYYSSSFSAGLSFERMEKMSLNFSKPPTVQPIADERAFQGALSYDFKLVKVFGQFQQTKLDNTGLDIKLKTEVLSASVPVGGTGFVLLSAGHTSKQQTNVADISRSTVTVGYDYYLSKRTDLYATALTDKVSNLDRGNGVVMGIRHTF